jgi:2-phospho-L-lactate/phosphoenolpyruvate guanylyltransferase
LKTVAVVPVKSLSEAKSRLSNILSPEERALLVLDMLSHVLGTLRSSPEIDEVAVISPQPSELRLPPTIAPIVQARQGLNDLLGQGGEWASERGADALLVLFADLPLISPGDISRMVKLGEGDGTIVLAPDRHGTGTNSMLAHPITLARFAFGPASFDAHRVAAMHAGANLEIYRSPGTSLDIDTLDDLDYLDAHRISTAMEYAFS